jgi:hypothetical protein
VGHKDPHPLPYDWDLYLNCAQKRMKPLSTSLAIALPAIISTAQIPNTLPQLVSKLFHYLHILQQEQEQRHQFNRKNNQDQSEEWKTKEKEGSRLAAMRWKHMQHIGSQQGLKAWFQTCIQQCSIDFCRQSMPSLLLEKQERRQCFYSNKNEGKCS